MAKHSAHRSARRRARTRSLTDPTTRRAPPTPELSARRNSPKAEQRGWEPQLGAVLRVLEVEPAAGVPLARLVAVRGDPARVLEHARDVQEVPGQERRVAI